HIYPYNVYISCFFFFLYACHHQNLHSFPTRRSSDLYITKPFNEEELLARMTAILRRRVPNVHVELNGLQWDKDKFQLTYKTVPIKLTPKEFIMIGHFMKNPNQVFAR